MDAEAGAEPKPESKSPAFLVKLISTGQVSLFTAVCIWPILSPPMSNECYGRLEPGLVCTATLEEEPSEIALEKSGAGGLVV